MQLNEVTVILDKMFTLLPRELDSKEARVMLLAIGLQESMFQYRKQMGNGPANGFWQFEQGTRASRGGVWGIYLHPTSRYWLAKLCEARNVKFTPAAIHTALMTDDILAAGCARLLLFTDPKRLPALGDTVNSWLLYAKRTWRPGKPHQSSWDAYYKKAMDEVLK